ncbi:hypothetical protein VP01_292g3 [Puccinia sorghi]|uniref:Uncharacterized protein n=1 Tax=Puccinia sorghi TaxID=27349 RepID=A0A0L6V189_9BASI|nr:hypothetical protein VP01_292g3 [Puccinia sorghi]
MYFPSQANVKYHKENDLIHAQGLLFCLETIITHISYGHHFMTLILFILFYVIVMRIHDSLSTGSINPDNPNHRSLTKPTQLSQTITICSESWLSNNLTLVQVDLSKTHTQKILWNLILSFSSSEDEPLPLPLSTKPVFKSAKATVLKFSLSIWFDNKAEFQPSAQQSVQNHNMLYIIKLNPPLGYSSMHCDCIVAKGFFYLVLERNRLEQQEYGERKKRQKTTAYPGEKKKERFFWGSFLTKLDLKTSQWKLRSWNVPGESLTGQIRFQLRLFEFLIRYFSAALSSLRQEYLRFHTQNKFQPSYKIVSVEFKPNGNASFWRTNPVVFGGPIFVFGVPIFVVGGSCHSLGSLLVNNHQWTPQDQFSAQCQGHH